MEGSLLLQSRSPLLNTRTHIATCGYLQLLPTCTTTCCYPRAQSPAAHEMWWRWCRCGVRRNGDVAEMHMWGM